MIVQSTSKWQCCENCKTAPIKNYKPVVNLKKSGLIIYIHESGLSGSASSKGIKSLGESKRGAILCNSGNKILNRYDYIAELCQYRTKCYKCRLLIQCIRDLIDNISIINKNEILGVCEYCKRSKLESKCKRCEYMVNKFIQNEIQNYAAREECYREKLYEVRKILISILNGHVVCKHNIYLHSKSKLQLDELLNTLNLPSSSRKPDINIFPNISLLQQKSDSSQILYQTDAKLKINTLRDYDLTESSSSESEMNCICKYFANRKNVGLLEPLLNKEDVVHEDTMVTTDKSKYFPNRNIEPLLNKAHVAKTTIKKQFKVSSENVIKEKVESTVTPDLPKFQSKKSLKTHATSKNILSDNIKHLSNDKNITSDKKAVKPHRENEGQKKKHSFDLMLKMMRQREKELKENKVQTRRISKVREFEKIEDLPVIKRRSKKITNIDIDKSESVVVCKGKRIQLNEMIKGASIVPYDPNCTDDIDLKLPLLFKIQADCNFPIIDDNESVSALSETGETKILKSNKINPIVNNSGIILYKLSNPEFIDNGWTQLPTTKIMRRINIYKMIPHTKFHWFENHKEQILFYDTLEKFAETYENGCGKWFYKDGNIALEYYNAAELNVGKRCIIYSSGKDSDTFKKKPTTVLACFDHLGNGIVYDDYGDVRLKYNQSEGTVIDPKVSPPCKWKWHTLNDPPILHQVFSNTYVRDGSCFKNNLSGDDERKENECKEIEAIELENLIKEKTIKLQQKFKPFKIRMKAVKINDYFSLRIIDQANIYIQFRCGRISHKFNIGMILKNDEIIGTEVAEVSEVTTSYDRAVPISNSIIDIQNRLAKIQKLKKKL